LGFSEFDILKSPILPSIPQIKEICKRNRAVIWIIRVFFCIVMWMDLFTGIKDNLSRASLSRQITDVWNLLNETALQANRTKVRARFEKQLPALRSQLQKAPSSPAVIKEVYASLTGIRQQMRLAGYDLSMGKYKLIFDGFRNDDSLGSGFRRAVLFIGEKNFYWRTGDDNHIMLAAALEDTLSRSSRCEQILQIHYLWFMRTKTTYILSGAATETAEDYETLKAYGQEDDLLFLSKLKGLC
jgi:hypothetical protein